MKKEEMCINCVFCEMNNGVTYCAVTGGKTETDGYCLTFKKKKMNIMNLKYTSTHY